MNRLVNQVAIVTRADSGRARNSAALCARYEGAGVVPMAYPEGLRGAGGVRSPLSADVRAVAQRRESPQPSEPRNPQAAAPRGSADPAM